MKKWLYSPTLLVMLVLSACTNVKDPEFRRIEKFQVRDVGMTDGVVSFSVTYYNPNNFGVTVKETEADVELNNVQMGKFLQDSIVNVNSKSEFSIPVTARIPISKFLQLNLRDLAQKDIQIKASGTTKLGKMGVFITKPIQYQGTHKLGDIKL